MIYTVLLKARETLAYKQFSDVDPDPDGSASIWVRGSGFRIRIHQILWTGSGYNQTGSTSLKKFMGGHLELLS